MAKFTGAGLVLTFGATTLTTTFRGFDPEEDMGTVDASAGADTARSYVNTLKDGKASIDYLLDNTTVAGDPKWTAVVPGTTATLTWSELGTATGNVKHSVSATVTSRKKSHPYDGLVMAHVEFVFNAAVTEGVN